MQQIDHIVNLLRDYLSEGLDTKRTEELERLFFKYPNLKEILEELDDEQRLQEALDTYEELYTDTFQEREERILDNVLSQIRRQPSQTRKGIRQRRIAVYASVAAAVIAVFFAVVFFMQKDNVALPTEVVVGDFKPGGNKASLTLSNKQQINLDDSFTGIVVNDQIVYEDGTILFDESSIDEYAPLTLSTPRGGQYQVTLSDGTKVWLNAESKLHYPYRFPEGVRHVELEGEAYFEVAHKEDTPFIVTTSKETVEVLGTHFNVNSYDSDMHSTVALLEGKVRVSLEDNKTTTVLEPGQQSLVVNGKMDVQSIDVDESVAWKNGEFMFNNETLESVMTKVARWYNLDIELSDGLKDVEIWGSVSRYDNFNTVLKLIKMTDDRIHFQVEGRRVKVMK